MAKKKKAEVAKEIKDELDKAIDELDKVIDEAIDDVFEEEAVKAEDVKPMTDIEVIEMIKQNNISERVSVNHRELGMAYDEVIKSLSIVQSWLKTLNDVKASINK